MSRLGSSSAQQRRSLVQRSTAQPRRTVVAKSHKIVAILIAALFVGAGCGTGAHNSTPTSSPSTPAATAAASGSTPDQSFLADLQSSPYATSPEINISNLPDSTLITLAHDIITDIEAGDNAFGATTDAEGAFPQDGIDVEDVGCIALAASQAYAPQYKLLAGLWADQGYDATISNTSS